MEGDMVYILATSIIFQIAAAVCAFKLIKTTGNFKAWTAISIAIALMAIRRSITLYQLVTGNPSIEPDMTAELVALVISALITVGVIWIFPIFDSIKKVNIALQKSNRALKTLSECNQSIIRISNEADLMQEICRVIIEVGDYQLAWVGFAEQDREKNVRPVAQYGFEEGYLEQAGISWANNKRGKGPTGTAIRTGKPSIARFILTDPNFTEWREAALARGYESSIALPLFTNDKTFGALNIYASEPDAFDDAEVKLLTELANDLSYAINAIRIRHEHEQAEEQISQQAARIKALLQTASRLNAQLDFDTVLRAVCEETASAMNVSAAWINLYDSEREEYTYAAGFGLPSEFGLNYQPPPRKLVDQIASRFTMVIPDVQALSEMPNAKLCASLKIRTIAFAILQREGQVIGLLSVPVFGEVHTFSQNELELLQGLSNQAAQAINNACLFTKAQRRFEQLNTLREIDIAITGSVDLRVSLSVLVEKLTAQMNVDAAAVLLLNPNSQILNYAAGNGFFTTALKNTHLRVGDGLAGKAALERRVIHIPDLTQEETDFQRSPQLRSEKFISYFAIPLISGGQLKGILEIFNRQKFEPNSEWLHFMETLAGQAAIAIDNTTLFDNLQRSNTDLVIAYDNTLEGWAKALELRDQETEGHTQRVTKMTEQLAREMGVDEVKITNVRRGAILHDIGKISVPDNILLKPGPLNEKEWEIMRKHPVYAYELLSTVEYLRMALDIPYCHHEKWDGTGYPRGLKGEQIPLVARIFAVIDVWDALRSDRPYRKAWSEPQALAYIKEQSGKHFDPVVVKNFLEMYGKMIG
ncbi:MAG: GAF domain-containing protein [Anaerolineaceae bacterium]|nr:MAG: GAF domain-containing protein [Anaerolineaceae bacterium]